MCISQSPTNSVFRCLRLLMAPPLLGPGLLPPRTPLVSLSRLGRTRCPTHASGALIPRLPRRRGARNRGPLCGPHLRAAAAGAAATLAPVAGGPSPAAEALGAREFIPQAQQVVNVRRLRTRCGGRGVPSQSEACRVDPPPCARERVTGSALRRFASPIREDGVCMCGVPSCFAPPCCASTNRTGRRPGDPCKAWRAGVQGGLDHGGAHGRSRGAAFFAARGADGERRAEAPPPARRASAGSQRQSSGEGP